MIELSPAVPDQTRTINPIQIGAALARFFTLVEIETLCFDLGFEYEELGEGGRTTKAIRLVKYFEREERLHVLAAALLDERPNLTWEELGRAGDPEANQAAGAPPYKGLAVFDVADADQFYGREMLTAELATHLCHHPFLAVVGASGSGKSSIVRAGLIPVLRGQKILPDLSLPEGSSSWPLHIITPTEDPLLSLAAELADSAAEALSLRDGLAANPERLKLSIQFMLKESGANRLLLFIDQFEETFTQCKDETIRRAFIDNLVNASAGQAVIVITLRADYYAACAAHDDLRAILSHQQVYIGPMNRDELRQAIEKPADRFGWKFENGLVDLLLEDIGATENRTPEPGALPLLSHALLETWKRREGVTMTLTGYIGSGGIRGAIAQTAEEVYQYRLRPEQRKIARRIFLRLTEIGEAAQDTRRRSTFSEMVNRNREEPLIEAVLLILTDARLVMVDLAEDESEKIVQVTHEALIREWPQLREWLDESRDGLRVHRQITTDTHNWIRLKRDAGALYRGTRLAQAVEWLQAHAPTASRVERAFIQAGRDALLAEEEAQEAARQRELEMARELAETQTQAAKRLRWMVWAAGGAAVAMLVLAGYLAWPTYQNWRDQREARGEMVFIPAGPAFLGTDNPDFIDQGLSKREQIELSPFEIGKYEVTNKLYKLCVDNNKCIEPFETTDYIGKEKEDLPVTNVTVLQASKFCEWVGQRLPTLAEWERAARGETGLDWPWGNNPPTLELANMPVGEIPTNGPMPFDSHSAGVSPEGVYNLIGNVWEWTSSYQRVEDAYDPDNFWDGKGDTFQGDQTFIVKGGGWRVDFVLYGAFEDTLAGGKVSNSYTGFRCASSSESNK